MAIGYGNRDVNIRPFHFKPAIILNSLVLLCLFGQSLHYSMQLQTLEIKGFKSFGDSVKLNFDAGITGIVGPNGCGKSNIVDAIRWVLGEQKTRALRSDKMENVIFNGTKQRKPQQMAEVSLTFGNTRNILPTEFSTVTITRRYYRTGESEYLLNGITCRLKDITNLFMDTGIGSDSYAIIELKMVDDLLNDRENSRRSLFEEAAGISKFKARKKETFKKLEDTSADLERVEDLLFEIQKNLKSLEKQAKQAEQYFQVKEEYKETSLSLARTLLDKENKTRYRLQKQVQEAVAVRDQLSAELGLKEATTEKEKAELLEKEKLLASRQKTLNNHVTNIRNLENEEKVKNEKLKYLSERLQNLQNNIQQDTGNHARLERKIAELYSEIAGYEAKQTEIKENLTEASKNQDELKQITTGIQHEATNAQKEFRTLQDRIFQARKSLEINEIQLGTLKNEILKQASEDSKQRENLKTISQKLEETRQLGTDARNRLQNLINDEQSLQRQLEQNIQDTEKNKEVLVKIQRLADAKQNEYNLTKSLVDSLEGFPEAIKFLKKQTNWLKEAPLLQDILTCPEEYRVCIEGFLDQYMNYYVVDNEDQALEAIKLLGRSAKGRANFFLLNRFENTGYPAKSETEHSTPALAVVEYDEKYAPIIRFLLQDVFIVENDSSPLNSNFTYLSQSGHLTRRTLSIGGGSVGIFEGKRIGRAKNLEKLQTELASLTVQIAAEKKKIADLQQSYSNLKQSTRKQAIEQCQKEINHLGQEEASLKARGEQMELLLKSTDLKSREMVNRIAQLEAEISGSKPGVESGQSTLKTLENRINELNAALNRENKALSEASAEFNRLNILFHQNQNSLSSRQQDLGYRQNEIRGISKRQEKNKADLQQAEAELRALHESGEIKDEELISLYAEKDDIEKGVNEAEKSYYSSRGAIDTAEKDSRELIRRRENNENLIRELNQKVTDSRLALAAITERVSVEFNLDLEKEARESENPIPLSPLSEDELKSKLNTIRTKIEKFGTVNPMAMEAYNEIKERHTFISDQKKDLLDAKNSLLQTIDEIDLVAKQAFMDTFTAIRENFINVFRSLFTGEDTADLVLTHPDNPLESAIDIIARPKGKRPLTINQLSGGEKTLTAISLLFAIYLIKPAPFCIFDEVDAPLDDANIDKFNNIIRKFSSDSQFIIVTHNKRTMVSTDVIYGVTMLEQGVSRLIPVDLRELV